MPNITFILPHWIYWGGILAVPAVFMLATRRHPPRVFASGVSLAVSYFFWAVGGFMGLHRLYLKSWGAAVFIILFVSIVAFNHEARQARNLHSIAKNDVFNLSFDLKNAQEEKDSADIIAALADALAVQRINTGVFDKRRKNWQKASKFAFWLTLVLLLFEALLMPRSVRQARIRRQTNAPPPPEKPPEKPPAAISAGAFSRNISKLNAGIGEFAAYWTIIAVFVFYYEVIARYIFNSPTIWAHESMFLLFGMQYMLAGGFCLRENAHVRVDVLYLYFSPRTRAIADLFTSLFFFIFTGALLVTGWIFFHDSFAIGQVSHTEWEIPHWPIKFALPLGGLLIILQGLANVLHNIAFLRGAKPTN